MDELDLGATIKGFSSGQKVFNRYTLQKILGRGGMGVVWLARDGELDREVALKFLPEVVAMDKQSILELKRETRRSLELTHPHIVRIYDFVQDGRTAAISMEYVSGDSLAALKMDQPDHFYSPGQLAKWVRQLCEALDYAHHKAEVVHRDLKPANLMIDARGDLKVADFGIAASVSDSVSRVSAQGGSSGTPVYMSPQQMMGEKPAVTDDVYSLGATLYDLLTGKPPFHTGNIIAQVQSKVPPSVSERRRALGFDDVELREPFINEEWEQTIAACLAKEAADRPQSAREVAHRLGFGSTSSTAPFSVRTAPVKPGSAPARKPVAPARAAPAPKKGPSTLLIGVVAAVLLAAGGLGYYFGVYAPAQQREAEAKARQEETARQAEQLRLTEGARKAEEQRLVNLRLTARITTDPAGAEVRVDDDITGLSPLARSDFKLGAHTVRIRQEGYDEQVEKIIVTEKGANEWGYKLVRSTGTLKITAVPAGPAKYQIYPAGAGAKGSSEVVAEGNLPAEVKLPTGRYEFRAERPGWNMPFPRVVEVKLNEAIALQADLRGGSFTVKSSPAGAMVYRGVVPIGQTPLTVDDIGFNQSLPLEVRLEGYQTERKDIIIADADHPQTWEVALREVPKPELHPDFTAGPSRVSLTAESQSRTTGRTTANGQTTTNGPQTNTFKFSTVYEMAEPDGFGSWSHVQSRLNGAGNVFQAGTVVDFLRIGDSWRGSIMRGGFIDAKLNNEELNPSYPALLLDADSLPPGPAESGRTWDVPVRSHSLMLRGLRFVSPTGSIHARVMKVDLRAAEPWADVEYNFDLSGETDRRAPDGYTMQQQLRATGTINLRLMLAAKYISSGRLRQHQAYQTTLTALGPSPEAIKAAEKAKHDEAVKQNTAAMFGLVGLAVKKATSSAPAPVSLQAPATQYSASEVDADTTITISPLPGVAVLDLVTSNSAVTRQAAGTAESRMAVNAAQVRTVSKISTLVIYRESHFVGSANSPRIMINGENKGKINNGTYWTAELPVGDCYISILADGIGETRANVKIETGKVTYLEMKIDFGSITLRPAVEGVATRIIPTLKPATSSPSHLNLPDAVRGG